MKKGEQLHRLIKTLTATEKKYIRIDINKFHPQDSSKKSLLFDSLNKQTKHLPEKTIQSYESSGYTSKFIAADRHQLYDLILENLTNFHAKTTAEIQLTKGYQKAIVLFEKKLFDQTLKQIDRMEKLAYRLESYGMLINLYHLKQRILKILNDLDGALNCLKKQEIFWAAQHRINSYIQLHYQSVKLRIELAKVRSPENLQKLDEFIKQPLLEQDLPTHLGFQEQFHYLETYCNYYFIQDDKEQELKANQALVDLIDRYPLFKKNEPLNYLIFATRILAIQRNLNPNSFLDNLAKYRILYEEFNKQRKQAESIVFIFSYNYELDYYMKYKQWDKGLEIIPAMHKGLKKHHNFIRAPLVLTAYYRIAYVLFFKQQYAEVLDVLDKILTDFPSTLRPDVYSFVLILKVITHYEIGNDRLMPHLIKTAHYHIRKRNLLFQTEKIALQYLKKLSKKAHQDKHQSIFIEFQSNLQSLIKDNPYEKRSLEIFDLLAWINSKIAKND